MGNPIGKHYWAKRWFQPVLALGLVALGAFAVGWLVGLINSSPLAVAGPPPASAKNTPSSSAALPEAASDYNRRVVARIYGSEEITREDLGEYLIARMGAEKLELLVNKRI